MIGDAGGITLIKLEDAKLPDTILEKIKKDWDEGKLSDELYKEAKTVLGKIKMNVNLEKEEAAIFDVLKNYGRYPVEMYGMLRDGAVVKSQGLQSKEESNNKKDSSIQSKETAEDKNLLTGFGFLKLEFKDVKLLAGAVVKIEDISKEITGDTEFIDNVPIGFKKVIIDGPYIKKIEFDTIIEKDSQTREIVTPEKATGSLLIKASPDKSEIRIDGEKQKDETPSLLNTVPVGEHTIEIYKDNYLSQEKRVTIAKDQRQELFFELKVKTKELTINLPDKVMAGDKVNISIESLDYSKVKKTVSLSETTSNIGNIAVVLGNEITFTKPGKYEINFEYNGKKEEKEITVLYATKIIDANIYADVYVNGRTAGTTPYKVEFLSEKPVIVELRKNGYVSEKIDFYPDGMPKQMAVLYEKPMLIITDNKKDADVYADGKHIGKTPLNKSFDTAVNINEIKISKGNYDDIIINDVVIDKGGKKDFKVELIPKLAKLTFEVPEKTVIDQKVEPVIKLEDGEGTVKLLAINEVKVEKYTTGSGIILDGKTIIFRDPGENEIAVTYETQQQKISRTFKINILYSNIKIKTEPDNVEIYVDGTKVKSGDVLGIKNKIESVKVEMKLKGYKDLVRVVDIKPLYNEYFIKMDQKDVFEKLMSAEVFIEGGYYYYNETQNTVKASFGKFITDEIGFGAEILINPAFTTLMYDGFMRFKSGLFYFDIGTGMINNGTLYGKIEGGLNIWILKIGIPFFISQKEVSTSIYGGINLSF